MRAMSVRTIWVAAALLAATSLSATLPQPASAQAQTWPQRPVRFVIPFGPGAGADIGARLIQEKLSQRWGKPVVIENRPGGDSIIAIQAVLSANDDHTFLWGPSGNFTVHPYQYKQMPYETVSDEEWEERFNRVQPLDWTSLYGADSADAAGEKFCTTDRCEMSIVMPPMEVDVRV